MFLQWGWGPIEGINFKLATYRPFYTVKFEVVAHFGTDPLSWPLPRPTGAQIHPLCAQIGAADAQIGSAARPDRSPACPDRVPCTP